MIYITGVGGMLGSHLIERLQTDNKVTGSYYKPTVPVSDIVLNGNSFIFENDVRYFANVLKVIESHTPDIIYHLAAQSYPSVSWDRPQETIESNVIGTINVFESVLAVRRRLPDYDPVIVVACSSAEYGDSLLNLEVPADEDTPLLPLHPYGVSKVAQDLLSYQYFRSNGIRAIRARIFNTTGPRKTNDVCADFTKRAIDIERGIIPPVLHVGNTETLRAITDVRDLVSALVLLAEKGKSGEAYNICGQNVYKISDIISIIRKNVAVPFETCVKRELLRPTDEKIIAGSSEKLISLTGWKQTYSLEQTVVDMLNYWRSR